MELLKSFREFVAQERLFDATDHLLLAVSGGVDSVVLCALCAGAGYRFSIVHCNFQLRGAESEGDAVFVSQLADRYQAPFYLRRFDTTSYAATRKVSIQVAARELRYDYFREILEGKEKPMAGATGAGSALRYIVTAHHADDNVETVLINLLKGTGIAGLRGMRAKHGNIVRPLLFTDKAALLAFAHENNLAFREDSSNSTIKYTRNYIRHEVLPVLEKLYPSVRSNLRENIKRLADVEVLYNEAIASHRKKLVEVKGEELHLPVLKLLKTGATETILFEILREFNFQPGQLKEVMKLLGGQPGAYVESSTHRLINNRKWLILAKHKTGSSGFYVMEAAGERISFQLGSLEIRKMAVTPGIPDTSSVAWMDASLITFPLILRRWKQGDYFYPLGMRKKKKINRFLIDQKLSTTEKERTWVVEMDKKIIWVVGRRIDDRFKVTERTREILELRLDSGV